MGSFFALFALTSLHPVLTAGPGLTAPMWVVGVALSAAGIALLAV
jgi:hypothetical protein